MFDRDGGGSDHGGMTPADLLARLFSPMSPDLATGDDLRGDCQPNNSDVHFEVE